ncbi:hypothetical protein [Nostoc sp. ChiQUE01b]|uniref:hypothetical protein n=1 Tax=Nostoc sp. ChiQUE01b TaxID=3075376 RepID=UPI002AD46853|nr:hypothetical protein [Nostoc sp. ChiQUE01b]
MGNGSHYDLDRKNKDNSTQTVSQIEQYTTAKDLYHTDWSCYKPNCDRLWRAGTPLRQSH